MIITHLKLRNWRNFRHVEVDLSERAFLIGPNAAGKSNFLDALRFLRDVAKRGGGLQKAVNDRGGLSKIRCLAAREHPDVEIEAHLLDNAKQPPEWKYALGIKQEARGHRQPLLSYERVWLGDQQLLNRPDDEDERDRMRLTQTHLEQIGANSNFRELARFFEAILYLHLVPQLVRSPEISLGGANSEDPFGRSFLERVVRTQQNVRRARLRKIEAALKLAVPQLKALTDVKDESGVPHLEALYEHWRPKGAKQREDQFSDGTLRLIGLLWSLLEGESVLLLEEPELSLNAGIVRKLPALMHRLQRQRKRQVIVSTHSADLLSDLGIGGEEALLLIPSREGTSVKTAASNNQVRALLESGLSIAEAALPHTVPSGVGQLELFE